MDVGGFNLLLPKANGLSGQVTVIDPRIRGPIRASVLSCFKLNDSLPL